MRKLRRQQKAAHNPDGEDRNQASRPPPPAAPNAPRATANPLRQRHLSKGSRPKATAFAFLPPGKPPETCTVTSVRVFARRGGAAGVKAKCLHGLCRHSRPSPCKESGAGHLSAHAAKPALRPRTTHHLPPSKNAARERSLRDEKEKYVTRVRVFARRGGAAGVEAKCLHGLCRHSRPSPCGDAGARDGT